jgi:FtsP/CotA-like multicopper oxidase with cupredoxin domain
MNRRSFLVATGATLATATVPRSTWGLAAPAHEPHPADLRLRIEPCTLDIGHGVQIKTVAYNGQIPGPLLRLKKGKPVSIDVTNASANPDIVHWHGLTTDPINDGAVEEGSSLIAPGATLRYHLTPNPSGTRWYHTHAMAKGDLTLAAYTGQFGFLLVDGEADPGRHDKEVNLAIRHWGPHFVPMIETMRADSQNMPT